MEEGHVLGVAGVAQGLAGLRWDGGESDEEVKDLRGQGSTGHHTAVETPNDEL